MVIGLKGSKAAFFVEVQDHVALRRGILTSLRDILDSLQKYHDFQRKKEQKAKKVEELKSIINRTNTLFLKLKNSLPEVAMPKIAKEKKTKARQEDAAENSEEQAPAPKQPSKQQKPKSELDALEDELAAIERKLNKLV
ncbi:MAG TPA: hypothetical protein VJB12_01345 [Candidatus Nanoarchaeia archaeon]|nr:hypothetical protein [Candidatus Nanoarchaeia archaeon]